MHQKPSNPIQFLKALGADYLTLCSGALSVPFVALGAFRQDLPERTLFLSLSVLSFLFASYRIWARERGQLILALDESEKLREAFDDRPKPEIFLTAVEELVAPGQRRDYFAIENRGISALNITFAPVMCGNVGLQFSPKEFLHDTGPSRASFVLSDHGVSVPAGSDQFQQAIQMFCSEARAIEVTLPVEIHYQATDERHFRTDYDMEFSEASLWCRLAFRRQTVASAKK